MSYNLRNYFGVIVQATITAVSIAATVASGGVRMLIFVAFPFIIDKAFERLDRFSPKFITDDTNHMNTFISLRKLMFIILSLTVLGPALNLTNETIILLTFPECLKSLPNITILTHLLSEILQVNKIPHKSSQKRKTKRHLSSHAKLNEKKFATLEQAHKLLTKVNLNTYDVYIDDLGAEIGACASVNSGSLSVTLQLLKLLNQDEINAVVAHEVTHLNEPAIESFLLNINSYIYDLSHTLLAPQLLLQLARLVLPIKELAILPSSPLGFSSILFMFGSYLNRMELKRCEEIRADKGSVHLTSGTAMIDALTKWEKADPVSHPILSRLNENSFLYRVIHRLRDEHPTLTERKQIILGEYQKLQQAQRSKTLSRGDSSKGVILKRHCKR